MKAAQTPEEAEAAFQQAVATRAAADTVIMVLGENANMAGEAASRGVTRSARASGRAAQSCRRPRQTRGSRPLERASAEHRLGGGERAGDPRGVGAWHRGRTRGCRHPVRRCQPGRQAAGHVPAQDGSQAPLYYARNLTHAPEGSRCITLALLGRPGVAARILSASGSATPRSRSTNLKVSAPQVKMGGSLTVTAEVANTGALPGDEVVQLYIHQRSGSDSRPMRELKGFERVTLTARREEDGGVPARPGRAPATGAPVTKAGCRTPRHSMCGLDLIPRRS